MKTIKDKIGIIMSVALILLGVCILYTSTIRTKTLVNTETAGILSDENTYVIKSGESIKQDISTNNKYTHQITLHFKDIDTANIRVSALDSNKNEVDINTESINNKLIITMPPSLTYVDQLFTITIENASDVEKGIYVSAPSLVTDTKEVHINNAFFDESGYNYTFKKGILILFSVIFASLSFCTALYYAWFSKGRKKYKHVDKLVKFVSRIHCEYILLGVLSLLLASMAFMTIVNYVYFQIISFALTLAIMVNFIFFSIYFVHLLHKKKSSHEHIFLILGIPIAIVYIILIIPNGVPDEIVHFFKTYSTSTFDFRSTAMTEIPAQIINSNRYNYYTLYQSYTTVTDYSVLFEVPNVTYNFILYLASGFGMLLGRLLNMPVMIAYEIARLCNAALFLAFGFISIKKLPIGKMFLVIFLLNPIMIQQGISVSADCVIHAVSIFAICYILYIKYDLVAFRNKDIIILSALFIIILLSKYNYLPIFGLLFMCWNKIKMLSKHQWAMIGLAIMIGISLMFAFTTIWADKETVSVNGSYKIDTGVDFGKQLQLIINEPLTFPRVFIQTLLENRSFYFYSFFGGILAWLDLSINHYVIITYVVLLISSLFVYDNKHKFSIFEKIWSWLLFGIMTIAIFLVMYLSWTEVGGAIILGVQGRYLLPFAPLLAIPLLGKKKIKIRNYEIISCCILVLVHSIVILQIINHFLRVY